MRAIDFMIIGDAGEFKGCLVYVTYSREDADKILERMLNNPNECDKRLMKGLTNFRIKQVSEQESWWKREDN